MTARAMFSGNFFACAGYEILDAAPPPDMAGGIALAREAKADVVVLCSDDQSYATLAPELLAALGKEVTVVIAGYPKDSIKMLQEAGIEHFIHMKSNLRETLKTFNKHLL